MEQDVLVVSVQNDTLFVETDETYLQNEVLDLNDGELLDVFLSKRNIEILIPNWKDTIDKTDVFNTLDYSPLERIKTIIINQKVTLQVLSFSVMPENDEDGEPIQYSVNDEWGNMPCMITFETKKNK